MVQRAVEIILRRKRSVPGRLGFFFSGEGSNYFQGRVLQGASREERPGMSGFCTVSKRGKLAFGQDEELFSLSHFYSF